MAGPITDFIKHHYRHFNAAALVSAAEDYIRYLDGGNKMLMTIAGAMSTAGDYLRFAQMLANGGMLDGQRVLSRTTVRLMTSDHLGSRIPLAANLGGSVLGASTYTFGLGFAVRPSDGIAPIPGSAGDFNWGGYAGTIFWVDPKEQLVATLMVQSAGTLRLYHRLLYRQLVYQAILD